MRTRPHGVARKKEARYDLEAIEFGSAAHLELHPFARVPVLRFDDTLVYETAAIGVYLNEALEGHQPWCPKRSTARVDMIRWNSAINDYCYQTMIREIVLPRVGVTEVDDSVITRRGRRRPCASSASSTANSPTSPGWPATRSAWRTCCCHRSCTT